MKILKKITIIALLVLGVSATFVWWANYKVESETESRVTSTLSKLPNEKIGLLLGTSKTLKSGTKNPYFYYRIDAAEQLYNAGKIKYILISGDNSTKNYSEPEDMQVELIERGIPKNHIFLDFAGFRTLDSVVRAKEIFGRHSFIIISQKFHNQRAVFLAKQYNIDAYGFNAKDVSRNEGTKTKIREKFARAKVFVDLLLGVEPKFGGKKVVIPD